MESRWDFYQCRVDGDAASIYVDLGWANSAPAPSMSNMAYVRVRMRHPRADGLSSQDEFEALIALEDSLVPQLEEQGSVVFVGRNTSGGCRDFYFYSRAQEDWQGKVEAAMRAHPAYRYETGIREDSGWSTYFEFLFPSDRAIQTIENRHVCEALQGRGDDLQKVRNIDHWAYFGDAVTRDRFSTAVKALGFRTEEAMEPDEENGYGIRVSRPDAPARVDDPVLALFDAAVEVGGTYDGWETHVVE